MFSVSLECISYFKNTSTHILKIGTICILLFLYTFRGYLPRIPEKVIPNLIIPLQLNSYFNKS